MSGLANQVDAGDGRLEALDALRDLRRPEPGSVVELLGRVGLTDADIAAGIGASERTVRRWRAEANERAQLVRKFRELDDLRALVVILGDDGTLTPDGIVYWLRARNHTLDHQRPLDVLARGDFDKARRAALAFADD